MTSCCRVYKVLSFQHQITPDEDTRIGVSKRWVETFYKIHLFKNEQALAEVIICVKAESGVIARTEILRLYLLQT